MATRWARGSAIAGLLATMILGCSDGNDAAGDGLLEPAEFVPIAADLICDDFGDCCAQDGYAYSAEQCRSGYARALEETIARGTVVYDADAGGRCVRALRASPGQCDGTPEELQACGGVFRGTVADGEPCVTSTECAGFPDSAFCVETSTPGTGQVCMTVPTPSERVRAGRGDSCTGTCRPDDGALYCLQTGPDPAALCFTEDGLYCARETSTCESLLAEGATCERDPGFPGCVAGTFCEHERCVPERGEGESCLVDICTFPLTCASPNEIACGPGLRCTVGDPDPRCVAPKADGSTCRSFQECASGWCEIDCDEQQSCSETGVCGPPKRTTREQCAGVFTDEASATSALVQGAR